MLVSHGNFVVFSDVSLPCDRDQRGKGGESLRLAFFSTVIAPIGPHPRAHSSVTSLITTHYVYMTQEQFQSLLW